MSAPDAVLELQSDRGGRRMTRTRLSPAGLRLGVRDLDMNLMCIAVLIHIYS